MSKWKRVCLALGIAVILGTMYVGLFGVQTFFAIKSRKIGREIPIVKSVPSELQDLSVSNARGQKLSFMGIEFEVPWDDVDESKSRIVGNWALIVFHSGNSIILCVDKPKGFILVCELRSMIAPGDPREVYDRIKDYAKKLGQAERKLGAVRRAVVQVCTQLGLDANRGFRPERGWN